MTKNCQRVRKASKPKISSSLVRQWAARVLKRWSRMATDFGSPNSTDLMTGGIVHGSSTPCLRLHAHADLTTAEDRVVTISGGDVLLVRRFDREKTGAGYQRARMVSGLTLLKTDDSPQSRAKWSYIFLVEELRPVSAPNPKRMPQNCSGACASTR